MATAPPCRCRSSYELVGQDAVDYLSHLEYVTELDGGWQFRCQDTLLEWVMPYVPKEAPPEAITISRAT